MKVEAWVFGSLTIFMIIVTPIYWLITADARRECPRSPVPSR